MRHTYYFENILHRFDPKITALLKKQYRLQREMDESETNIKILRSVFNKLIAVCVELDDWWVYLESHSCMMRVYFHENKAIEAISLSMEYLRAANEHLEDAALKHTDFGSSILSKHSYNLSGIADIYINFHQIDDEKMDKLIKIINNSLQGNQYKSGYHQKKLGVDLLNLDYKSAKKNFEMFLKLPSNLCYVCNNSVQIDYYVMMDQPERAVEWIERVLRKEIPQDTLEEFPHCVQMHKEYLYGHMLKCAVFYGKIDVYIKYMDVYYEALLLDRKTIRDSAYVTFGLKKDFSELEDMLEAICDDIDAIKTDAPLLTMQTLLSIAVYLHSLDKSGVHELKLTKLEKPMKICDAQGVCNTKALEEYALAAADTIGKKFDKSRKKFDYARIRAAYIQLRDMHM